MWIKRTSNRCSTHPETDEVKLDVVGLDVRPVDEVRLEVLGNDGLIVTDSLGVAVVVPPFTENGSL